MNIDAQKTDTCNMAFVDDFLTQRVVPNVFKCRELPMILWVPAIVTTHF